MYVRVSLIVLLAAYYVAIDTDCDIVKNVQAGETYYIYNKEYPHNFTSESQCRWIVTCPIGYNCRIDCNLNMSSETASCSTNRLLISRTGDPDLNSSEYHCGHNSVTAVSVERTISVALISLVDSSGGRFICQLVPQRNTSNSSREGH